MLDKWNGVAIKPGTKTKYTLPVGSTPLGEVELPVWFIRSEKPGPVFSVTAGVHGCEYPGILAAIDLFNKLEPTDLLCGTLVIVPTTNPLAFDQKSPFVNPVDAVNLNRVFPGDPKGSMTPRLAHALFDKVLSVSDYVVDLHAGDLFERLITHTKYLISGNDAVDQKSEALAKLVTDCYYEPRAAGEGDSLFTEVAKAGVPAIIVEAGSEGFLYIDRSDYNIHYNGVLNCLRWSGMLQGDVVVADRYERVIEQRAIRANEGGFLVVKDEVGTSFKADAKLGQIIDFSGQVKETITAPFKDQGVIMMRNSRGVVCTGEVAFILWRTSTEEGVSVPAL